MLRRALSADPGRAGWIRVTGSESWGSRSGPLDEMRAWKRSEGLLFAVERAVGKHDGLPREPWLALNASYKTDRYLSALRAKDWPEADRTYLEALRPFGPALFRATLRAQRWAAAINVLMAEELTEAPILLRYIDVDELVSYAAGTFESRIEADGRRRGYKAFSLSTNHFSVERPVIVAVPVDAGVRRAVELAEYTALPRPLEPPEERMGDGKHIAYANETECRLPDGARMPSGTEMLARRDRLAPGDLNKLLYARDSLGVDVRLI